MRLEKFLKQLKEEVPDYQIPEYDQGSLIDALMADKPELELEEVFGESFYPKVKRWLDNKLKNVRIPSNASNLVGGKFGAKLDNFLEKNEVSDEEYRDNAATLAREVLNAIEEWDNMVIKPMDLPEPRFN